MALALLSATPLAGIAQTHPSRPARIVAAFAPGLTTAPGQPVIVDNRDFARWGKRIQARNIAVD